MRVTIIPLDGLVGVDGVFREVGGLPEMFPYVRAIQWGETAPGAGHIEWLDGHPNDEFNTIGNIQPAIDAWNAQTPPAKTAAEIQADALAEAKYVRTSWINSDCATAITGGYVSSALGAPHTYDSAETDQLNLIGAVGLGVDIEYKCADAAGVKAFRLHTNAQLRQVMADGAVVKLAALQKAKVLKDAIAAAQTVGEVESVVW